MRAFTGQPIDTEQGLGCSINRVRPLVDAVVLAGSVGLDSPWAGGTPRALLPLPNGLVITRLIEHLHRSIAGRIIVCTNGSSRLLRRAVTASVSDDVPIVWHEDRLPMGTAGCIKACEGKLEHDHFLVVGGTVWLETDPRELIDRHLRSGHALSIVSAETEESESACRSHRLRPLGVYCCSKSVLDHMRRDGFQDIKEQLIPSLIRTELGVGTITIKCCSQEVLDWKSYLRVVSRAISTGSPDTLNARQVAPGIWCGANVELAPDARIVGPAYLGAGTTLEAGSVVVGPAILGPACRVGAGSWLLRAVLPAHQRIEPQSTYNDHFGPVHKAGLRRIGHVGLKQTRYDRLGARSVSAPPSAGPGPRARTRLRLIAPVFLSMLFCWAFWPTLRSLWRVWQTNLDYSAGQLVPLTVVYMLAARRDLLSRVRLTFSPPGLLLCLGGWAMNVFGEHYLFASLANMGMLLSGLGLVFTLIGWSGFRKLWYPLVFLALMVPLPRRIHDATMLPMQEFGARVSETALEIGGIPVVRLGHVLEVAGHRIAVAEACNGLRLVLAFLIVTGVAAYLVRRPGWQKAVVILSAVPIALACNVLRIVATASLYAAGYAWLAEGVFHDGVGVLMMPAALGLVWLELRFLATLALPEPGGFRLKQLATQPAISA